jgi:hypothetical protein
VRAALDHRQPHFGLPRGVRRADVEDTIHSADRGVEGRRLHQVGDNRFCGTVAPSHLCPLVIADQRAFSVDYPYESSYEAVEGFERTTLSAADREKIAHGNAERLLRIS